MNRLEIDNLESTYPLLYLARLNFETGERKESIIYIERAYKTRKLLLGENNILTIEAVNFYLQFLIGLR